MTTSTIEDIDPKKILFVGNVRRDAKAGEDLVESVRKLGILQMPVTTINADGAHELVFGHRRVLAAAEVGLDTIRVNVVDEHTAAGARLIDQIAENEIRESLTPAELARGYKDLTLLGYSLDEIAERTRKPRAQVEAGLTVADSEKIIQLVETRDVDLVTAATIAEFADDKKTVAALTEKALSSPNSFDYAVQQARRARSLAESKKALKAKLKADGVPVVPESDLSYYGSGKPGKVLTDLATAKGANLTLSNHKNCPGHAAYLYAGYYAEEASIVYGCTDWEANGHKKKTHGAVETEEQAAERQERARAEAALIEEQEITRTLRTQFIAALLQRNKPASLPGHDRIIAHALAGHARGLISHYDSPAGHALDFLQLDPNDDLTPDEQLARHVELNPKEYMRVAIAAALATFEYTLRRDSRTAASPVAKRLYLETLTRWGHNLTDLEQRVLDTIIEDEADRAAEAAAAQETPASDEPATETSALAKDPEQ